MAPVRTTADLAIPVDLESDVPLYQQLADEVRGLVARGALADGDVLPSVRDLGRRVGVNLNTVARAYRILADEGLVDLRHGAAARITRKEPKKTARRVTVEADEARRLDDLIARWVVRGADRRAVEELLREAARRHFEGGKR